MLSEYKEQLLMMKGRHIQILADRKLLKKSIKEASKELEDYNEALLITQFLANQIQADLQYKIGHIVTHALASIWEDPYEFKALFDIKYGKTEAQLLLERYGNQISPKEASGGGVVDVVCFALRLALHTLNVEKSANVYILDEPFRFMEKPLQGKLINLVNLLCKKLEVQVIMITHEPEITRGSDKIISLGDDQWMKEYMKA